MTEKEHKAPSGEGKPLHNERREWTKPKLSILGTGEAEYGTGEVDDSSLFS